MRNSISRRRFLAEAAAVGATVTLGKGCARKRLKSNVIWIVLDCCRARNLSCYGYERLTTPNINKLASRGVLFEQHFSQAGHTYYSVPSYLTGRYFPTMYMDIGSPFSLWRTPPNDEKLISVIMKENGYDTCMVSAHPWMSRASRLWHSVDDSYFVPPAEKEDAYAPIETLVEQALSWIDQRARNPFFLYIHAMDTHWPHTRILGTPFAKWTDSQYPHKAVARGTRALSKFNKNDQEFVRGVYDGDILYSDAALGNFFSALEGRGLIDNTVILVGSDHGEALAEDGVTIGHPNALFSDDVLHVPLIMAGPGLPQDHRVTRLTENSDIVPTLMDLHGIESAIETDGRSMMPLIEGTSVQPIHGYTFAKKRDYVSKYRYPVCTIILRTADEKYAVNWGIEREELWAVPDLLGSRREHIRESSQATEKMRHILHTDIVPKWNAYHELPFTSPTPFEILFTPERATPREAFDSGKTINRTDNRWWLRRRDLLSTPWTEDAPPITFEWKMPNSRYEVWMTMRSVEDHWGHPGAAFLVKAQDDAEFRKVSADIHNEGQWQDVLLGEYSVVDETFVIVLDEADKNLWASARKLVFRPVSASEDILSREEREALDKQLRSLGYLK